MPNGVFWLSNSHNYDVMYGQVSLNCLLISVSFLV